jgi:phage terminase large subunit-like protein
MVPGTPNTPAAIGAHSEIPSPFFRSAPKNEHPSPAHEHIHGYLNRFGWYLNMKAAGNAAFEVETTSTPPWSRWRGSQTGRRIKFIESFCIVPRGVNAGQPIKLLPAQRKFIEKTYAAGILSAALSCPRGNGKTGLLACIALSELYLNPWSPDISVCATTMQQSMRPSGVYGIARRMMQLHPVLSERTLVYRGTADPRLVVPATDGVMAPLATRDPDALLGLSSSLLIADEFGSEHWDDERWGNLVQSGGKRGGDSRVIGISTPNSQDSAMFTLRKRVMAGTASPSVSWTEYAARQDADINDTGEWHRANFALGHFLDISALRADVVDRPEWLFRQMRLGQWMGVGDDGWLGADGPGAYDATTTDVKLDRTEPVHIGVDKSMRDDCSAVSAMQQVGDRWRAKVMIWIPESGVIDHAAIRDHIRELCRKHHVVSVAYDPRYFVEGAQELATEGLPMVEIPQTPARMIPAYSTLHRLIIDRKLDHDDDPVLRSHVLRAVPQVSGSGFMLAKSRTRTKIDGVVSMAIALAGSGEAHEPETEADDEMFGVH